jgi:SDR family mycofactocin-dependent oxidoreductase
MDGKVAFVTGAARGQGRSHALTLAREGADVILFDIAHDVDTIPYPLSTPEDLQRVAKEVEALDRRVLAIEGDTRRQQDLDDAVARAIDEFGRIDVLVANAGVWAIGAFWELSDEEWQTQIDVNLTGNWRTARAVAPHMIERRSGAMVITASVNGLVAGVNYAHYTAAKHGVVGFVRTAAVELGPYGVRCNAVCPGIVDSMMNDGQGAWDMMAGAEPGGGTAEDRVTTAAHLSALAGKGLIDPQFISNAVLWLASDEAEYVTGHIHPVDAGMLALTPFNPSPVR